MAQEETKSDVTSAGPTDCATSAARMPGEVNLSLCQQGQIPHSTEERKEAKASFQHILPNLLQQMFMQTHPRCSPITSPSLPGWEKRSNASTGSKAKWQLNAARASAQSSRLRERGSPTLHKTLASILLCPQQHALAAILPCSQRHSRFHSSWNAPPYSRKNSS